MHFDELTGLLQAAGDGPPDPARVVRFAAQAVPHTAACGLTLIRGRGKPATVASTAELTCQVDTIQYETREGPCLEANGSGDIVRVNDLATDLRWPRFGRRCVEETGVLSLVSLRLCLSGQDRGALTFYAGGRGAFDDLAVGIGAVFAPFAALALQNAVYEQEVEHLQTALRSSRQIGTAVGILMARALLTSDQAFAELVRASQHLNRKLRDIAAEVEQTGQLPAVPPGRRAAGTSRRTT